MTPTFDALTPAVLKSIDATHDLLAVAAKLDASNAVRARIQCWNGTIIHEADLYLPSARQRRAFAQETVKRAPSVAEDAIERLLLEYSATLPSEIASREKGAASAAVQSGPAAPAPTELYAQARALLENPKLLDCLDSILRTMGLVGEHRNARLAYLSAITRLLEKPVSIIVKGPSSAGKSFLLKTVITLLPSSAYVDYTSISPKYLAYSDDDLKNRIVVLYEAGGISDGQGAYIMRSLLSEGRLNIGTVEKEGDGNSSAQVARRAEKEGPTALWTSTTRVSIDAELETRALSVTITDTEAHSRAILRGAAASYVSDTPEPPDLTAWHSLQDWLAVAGERRVRIPYAMALADLVPAKTVRIRRDFGKLLALIEASAILFQTQRGRGDDGAIVATLDDYAIVRDLLLDSFTAAQEEGVTDSQREAVETVAVLQSNPANRESEIRGGVTLKQVAEALSIDKSAASRRLVNPLRLGYVRDLKANSDDGRKKRGKPAAYVVGEPLPAKAEALPTVERIRESLRGDAL